MPNKHSRFICVSKSRKTRKIH